MNRTANVRALTAVAVVAFLSACADEPADPLAGGGPTLVEMTDNQLVVGEQVLFLGHGFKRDEEGTTRLHFVGQYVADDGGTTDTDFTVTPLWDGRVDGLEILRLSRFGPFEVPFGVQATGTFRGSVRAVNVLGDGSEVIGQPMSTNIKVGPSIVIEELQPIIAECGTPALRGIGGLPYQMTVRAVGFTPVRFEYEINNINGWEGTTPFTHTAAGPTDVLGADEPFVLNPLKDEQSYYVTEIRIIAYDAKEQAVEQVLPFSVHRPIEYFYDGNLTVGEFYEPVPVTGCIPGSIGNRVTYSEQVSETRQQSLSITVSRNWAQANGTSASSNWQEGYSEGVTTSASETTSANLTETNATSEAYGVTYNNSTSNNVGFSSTDGETWGWDTTEGTRDSEKLDRMNEISGEVSGSVAASGGAKVPLLAEGSVTVTAGVKAGGRTGSTRGTATETSSSRGFSGSGSTNESKSFGSTTTDSTGTSVTGSYALSNTASRGVSNTDTEARSQSRTYNLGGNAGSSQTISEGMSEAESQTWVESSSTSTLTSYSGVIPVGRFGVFYRQTIRNSRTAQLRSYDLCGQSSVQSEIVFNEYTWSPDLAIGDSCDNGQLPESNLPKGECFTDCQ